MEDIKGNCFKPEVVTVESDKEVISQVNVDTQCVADRDQIEDQIEEDVIEMRY